MPRWLLYDSSSRTGRRLLGLVVQTVHCTRGLLYHSPSCIGEFPRAGDTDSWSTIPPPHDFNYTV